MPQTDRIGICVVIYSGVQMSAVLGLADLFDIANGIAKNRSETTPLLLETASWEVASGPPPNATANAAVVILPPALGPPVTPEAARPVAEQLRAFHARGSVLTSVCAGTFLLAESGLLDGRAATTHWTFAEVFAQRFPGIRLDTDRLITDDGDIITAGGLMAWTDLGLKIVDRFLGPAVMMETAQMLLVDPPGREQRYYSSFVPRLNHGDAAILKVQHWLQSTGGKEAGLADLAAKAGLEKRTFLRRFQQATGLTSTSYAQRLRIGKARELLQFSRSPVDTVAWEVGYSDPAAFRKVFLRVVGLSPSEYRRRFHA